MAWTSGTASGHEDLLEKFRKWIAGYGTATTPDGTGNTGNGTCSAISTTNRTKTESWTVTCTVDTGSGDETWSVTGSVSGAQTATATTGVQYTSDDGSVRFTISDGATDFVAGDEWTFDTTAGGMSAGEATTPVADGGNTGNGTMSAVTTSPTTLSETWTITCNDASVSGSEVFSVTGSVSGLQAAEATVGVEYVSDSGEVVFTISDGATDFIVTDEFTFTTSEGQEWTDLRYIERGAWSRSSTTATLTWPGHNLAVGQTFAVTESSDTGAITDATKTILTVSGDDITFTCLNAGDTAGYLTATTTYDTETSSCTWTRSTATATVTWNNHGLEAGDTITVSSSSATGTISNGTKTIASAAANTFTFTCTDTGSTSGTLVVTLNETHIYLKGRGTGGDDEIFVNLRSYSNSGGGYYNIELRGATSFNADAATARTGQLNVSGLKDLCLWSGSMPYWFIGNGRRFIIAAKVSTVYESAYAGFILPTGLPSEYPYPLAIGGSQGTTRKKYDFTASAYSHRACWSPNDSLQLLDKAGVWKTFANWSSDNDTVTGNLYRTFPYAGSTKFTSSYQSKPIYPNIDGTYTLFPVTLFGRDSSSIENIYGDFDGIYLVSGHNNASENIVQAGGVDHLVIQNTFRTTAGDYAAFALE